MTNDTLIDAGIKGDALLKHLGLIPIGPKYITYDGALNAARRETAIQPSEVRSGLRVKAYRWFAVNTGDGFYRVCRHRNERMVRK